MKTGCLGENGAITSKLIFCLLFIVVQIDFAWLLHACKFVFSLGEKRFYGYDGNYSYMSFPYGFWFSNKLTPVILRFVVLCLCRMIMYTGTYLI
jgi:hypothetical protein